MKQGVLYRDYREMWRESVRIRIGVINTGIEYMAEESVVRESKGIIQAHSQKSPFLTNFLTIFPTFHSFLPTFGIVFPLFNHFLLIFYTFPHLFPPIPTLYD